MKIPSIHTEGHEDGSPEPEYEEAADLATSIARLRSLLEQKSSESNMSTPAVSPMWVYISVFGWNDNFSAQAFGRTF